MSEPKISLETQVESSKIDENLKQMIAQKLTEMKEPVTIRVFSSKDHCLLCNEMLQLIEEVRNLSEKIIVEYCEWDTNNPTTEKYDIKHHPSLIIEGDKDYGIRILGVPLGNEFMTLIESIILVSNREPQMSTIVKKMLLLLDKKVNIKVFVSLKCPYCPAMVRTAFRLALANDKISAEMIIAPHLRDLAIEFTIQSYPTTIVNNGIVFIVGVIPEDNLLKIIFEALNRAGGTNA